MGVDRRAMTRNVMLSFLQNLTGTKKHSHLKSDEKSSATQQHTKSATETKKDSKGSKASTAAGRKFRKKLFLRKSR